jgi:hypothetical protein
MKTFVSLYSSLTMAAMAGPFPGAAGTSGSDAIAAGDSRITLWASGATVVRGPVDIAIPDGNKATFGAEADALGPADATPGEPYPVISLGDGGSIVLIFFQPFCDIPGPDFAVFENGFVENFLELAHVEVSSDGVNFFRFPSISLTAATGDLGQGGALDPSDIDQLAGKYLAGFGTPFDLARLPSSPLLDKQRITHVKVMDVVGSSSGMLGTKDSAGRMIVDPYPTVFFSAGFDLDAVGAFSASSASYSQWVSSQIRSDPSPTADPSGTGVPQGVEFFTGGTNLFVGEGISFDWLSYRSAGEFRIEGSDDLEHWVILAKSVSGGTMMAVNGEAMVTVGSGMKKRVAVDLVAGSRYRFFRLAAE